MVLTSTPKAVNWDMIVENDDEISPTIKWHSNPTPSMGVPAAFNDLTRLIIAVAFAPNNKYFYLSFNLEKGGWLLNLPVDSIL